MPDGLSRLCKNCQKIARDKSKTKHARSRVQNAYNKRVYKKVHLKALNPAKRTCLKCGKIFDSKDETDRFCPPCKASKKQMENDNYFDEDFGIEGVGVE